MRICFLKDLGVVVTAVLAVTANAVLVAHDLPELLMGEELINEQRVGKAKKIKVSQRLEV